jgi:hypothetical protein
LSVPDVQQEIANKVAEEAVKFKRIRSGMKRGRKLLVMRNAPRSIDQVKS